VAGSVQPEEAVLEARERLWLPAGARMQIARQELGGEKTLQEQRTIRNSPGGLRIPDRKQAPDVMSELMAGQATTASKPGPALKATFYLSPGAIAALAQVWMTRRQKAGPQQRGRISNSLLVEEAINLLSKDMKYIL
jgi:hypothetical protein